jgi:hypothetical protein
MGEEKTYSYFMQDVAITHNANYSINVLNKVTEGKLICHRLWPARSPDLYPCDLSVWGNLKNKVYSNNPHILDELKHIFEPITSVKVSELKLVSNNILKRPEVCLRAERGYFEHLL